MQFNNYLQRRDCTVHSEQSQYTLIKTTADQCSANTTNDQKNVSLKVRPNLAERYCI